MCFIIVYRVACQAGSLAMRDALSIFDRVVSFSGKHLTRQAVTENLNVLDYETYFKSTDLILDHQIPELLIQFNKTLAKGFDGHHYIAGLASHFRDLLVCKNPKTIELLEVGEETSQHYLEQSQKTSFEFLLKGIELANDCDLKYKSSKNQRLLVELCLMQLASITFDGEKKNNTPFIIPPSYFKTKGIKAIPVVKPENSTEQQQNLPEEPEIYDTEEENLVKAEEPKVKIDLNIPLERTSGLSLKSIRAKKEHQIRQMDVIIDEESLPNEPFTEEAFMTSWKDYISELHNNGKKIMASILEMNVPKLNDTTISLEFPNDTLKIELERAQFPLMEHLRKSLNNYDLKLEITVNEEASKQYAFTTKEKYERLKAKNPNIELLKKTFGLDIN